ncbi:MAG: 4-hydroxy-3-methylbut-2-enyl diphosphate reductase [Lachnospiraceae bacterium]|nr:4-hydroxy-3-methylbut-2-enyl diphosphate reductase [Lachnospiraceae bacterium]
MECIVAKTAGFCFGVQRAVDMAFEAAKEAGDNPVYTYGEIIHNEEVVRSLEENGAKKVDTLEDLLKMPKGTVIIRSHGITDAEENEITNAGFSIIDATCPFVKKIHSLVRDHSKNGEFIIIVGDPDHPEVIGIKGRCVTDRVFVLKDEASAADFTLPEGVQICVVAQTTFNVEKFNKIVEILNKKNYNDRVCSLNTICNATQERQNEAKSLASSVEAMIVIGGVHSSNTQKLYEICSKECRHTFYIQTKDGINSQELVNISSVGITAGASTPKNIIEEVQKYVRNEL